MLSFSDEENRRSFCLFSTVSVVSGQERRVRQERPTYQGSLSHRVSLPQSLQHHSSSLVCRAHGLPHTISVTGPDYTRSRRSALHIVPIGIQISPALRSLARIVQGSEGTCVARESCCFIQGDSLDNHDVFSSRTEA